MFIIYLALIVNCVNGNSKRIDSELNSSVKIIFQEHLSVIVILFLSKEGNVVYWEYNFFNYKLFFAVGLIIRLDSV